MKIRLPAVLAFLCLAGMSGMAQAEQALDLSLPSSSFLKGDVQPFILAENDAGDTNAVVKKNLSPTVAPAAEFEPPLITGSNVHEFLGLGAVALAGMAMVTAPGEGCEHNCPAVQAPRDVNGTHAQLAKGSAALAVAAVASGLISHWDDFSLEDGWSDPDNLHVLLATAGALLMAYAVDKSMNSSVPVSHAGMAEVGALGMLVAIKLTW